jgi:hypothetical protein
MVAARPRAGKRDQPKQALSAGLGQAARTWVTTIDLLARGRPRRDALAEAGMAGGLQRLGALIASQLSNPLPRAKAANGVTGYDQPAVIPVGRVGLGSERTSNRDAAPCRPHLPGTCRRHAPGSCGGHRPGTC